MRMAESVGLGSGSMDKKEAEKRMGQHRRNIDGGGPKRRVQKLTFGLLQQLGIPVTRNNEH